MTRFLRRVATVGVALCLGAGLAHAQSGPVYWTGSITTAGADCTTTTRCVEITDMRSVPSLGVYLDVGTSGTFNFEATINGTTWFAVADDVTAATTATADGYFAFSNPGYRSFRVRASAINGAATLSVSKGYVGLRSTASLTGGGGDGALIDGVSAAIKATVLDLTSSNPLTAAIVDANGAQITSFGGGTQYAEAATAATITGTAIMFESNTGTNTLSVVNNTTPLPVSDAGGSLTVDNGGTFAVQAAQSGTWTVQPGNTANTTAWLIAGGKTNNNAAPGATNLGALTVLANASAPTWSEGNLVALSSDLAGALRIAGAVSCSNCSGTGASKVDDAAFTIATDSVAPAGFLADQVAPDSVNEGDVGLARMTLARIQLHTLWDAAGNERGANVNASNELLVAVSSLPSHAVTNAGTFAVQADTELPSAAALADATSNPTVPGVAGFNMCWNGSTWDRCRSSSLTESTFDGAMTASSTVGNSSMLYAKAAAPTDVSADGDAVLPWALRNGSQVVNIAAGSTLVTATSTSLNVNCTGGCSGGTQYTEDAAETAGATLTMAGAVRRDSAASSSGTDGDNSTLNVDALGRLWVNCGTGCSGGTQYTHDAALTIGSSSTTLSGARASAAVPTDVSADNDAVALWALRSGALAVQTTLGGVLASANSGNVGTGVQRVVLATDQPAMVGFGIYAEDAAETAGGNLSMAGTVRRDSAATSAGTDGDNATLNTDALGRLWVNCGTGCSGGTQYTHDAALTIGSSSVTLSGARASAAAPTNVSADNDAVALWALQSGALATQPTYGGVLSVAGNGVSGTGVQRVTIASDSTGQVALAAGSATIGALTANQSVNVAQINGVTTLMGAGNTGTGSQRVTIATDQAAMVGLGIYAEDAAETAGGNLSMSGTVRRDTQASSAGTTGDNATLNTDATGNLWVTGTSIEDAAETAGGTLLMAGAVRRDTLASSSGTTGDNSTINTNAIGALWVSQYDPCSSEAKTTAPFSLTARGVIIAASASKKNYICSIAVVAGAAEIFNIVEGTGTTCQTGTAAVVGSTTAANGLSFAANGGFTATGGNASAIAGISSNVDTCIMPSSTNRLSGYVTYVQR